MIARHCIFAPTKLRAGGLLVTGAYRGDRERSHLHPCRGDREPAEIEAICHAPVTIGKFQLDSLHRLY
jgi:hypothetical protein